MKKLIGLLLALSMLTFCSVCLAQEDVLTEGDYTYTILENGTVSIMQYDTFNDNETVKIPSMLGGKQVTELGDWSFSGCTAANVVIPEGVTSIGEGAFSFSDALETIAIPASVMKIGVSAFEECSSLTSATIPGSVKIIEEKAFIGCSSLASASLGDGVTTIGPSAFYDCAALETVSLPSSIKLIDSAAFDGCSSLISLKLPVGIETIETYAFRGCSALETINLPASLTDIGACILEECDLVTVTLKENSFAEAVCESYGYSYEYEE